MGKNRICGNGRTGLATYRNTLDEFSVEEAVGVVLKKFKKMKSIIGNEEIIVHVYDKPSMKNFGDFNFDKTVESISVTSNLEELEKLVSS